MKNVLLRMLTLFAVAVMCFATSVGQNSEDVRHFDYDKSAPLDIKTIGTQQNENATVYDITYASPKGGVVPAYLVVPKGPGKFGHYEVCGNYTAFRTRICDVVDGCILILLRADGLDVERRAFVVVEVANVFGKSG